MPINGRDGQCGLYGLNGLSKTLKELITNLKSKGWENELAEHQLLLEKMEERGFGRA